MTCRVSSWGAEFSPPFAHVTGMWNLTGTNEALRLKEENSVVYHKLCIKV